MRSYLCAFLYFVLPIFSASQDQIFGKFLDFQKILEKKLYEIDCNLIKDKLTEQIYISKNKSWFPVHFALVAKQLCM